MPAPARVTFSGGAVGAYAIDTMRTLVGEALAPATHVTVHEGVWHTPEPDG